MVTKSAHLVEAVPLRRLLDRSKLHVLAVATHTDGYLPTLLQSAVLLGYNLQVLGWQQPWGGFRWKWELVKQYCEQVLERRKLEAVAAGRCGDNAACDDVVVVLDAFDTVLVQPPEVLWERYWDFGGRIVVTGETTSHRCYFGSILFEAFHNALFIDKGDEWKSLPEYAPKEVRLHLVNSGSVASRVPDMIRLVELFEPGEKNDQRWMTKMYLKDELDKFALDASCHIFHLWRGRSHVETLSHEVAAGKYPYKAPYFNDREKNSRRFATRCSILSSPPGITTTPVKQQSWSGTYGDPRPSVLKRSVCDKDTRETPCVLHIHCRRNFNSTMKELGLLEAHTLIGIRSYLWYIYYCSKGTFQVPAYFFLLASLVVAIVGAIILLVCFLLHAAQSAPPHLAFGSGLGLELLSPLTLAAAVRVGSVTCIVGCVSCVGLSYANYGVPIASKV